MCPPVGRALEWPNRGVLTPCFRMAWGVHTLPLGLASTGQQEPTKKMLSQLPCGFWLATPTQKRQQLERVKEGIWNNVWWSLWVVGTFGERRGRLAWEEGDVSVRGVTMGTNKRVSSVHLGALMGLSLWEGELWGTCNMGVFIS